MSKKVGVVIFVVASIFVGILISNLVNSNSKEARYNDARAQMIESYSRQTETAEYKQQYKKMQNLREIGLPGLECYR